MGMSGLHLKRRQSDRAKLLGLTFRICHQVIRPEKPIIIVNGAWPHPPCPTSMLDISGTSTYVTAAVRA